MRDGVLVGYVPIVAGSARLNDQATVRVIARTDYDAPYVQRRERAVAAAHFPSLTRRVARAGAVGRRPVAVWMPARPPAPTEHSAELNSAWIPLGSERCDEQLRSS